MNHLAPFSNAIALGLCCLVIAVEAHAEDFECRGTVGPVTVSGKLLVPDDATCVLNGTNVRGDVLVKSRATLRATGVTTSGSLQGEGPAVVVVGSSTIGNNVTISKLEPNGKLELGTSRIGGDVQLQDNRGLVVLRGNQVTGSIQASKNTMGVTISSNQIGNGLQCQENQPPPAGGGNVAKQKQGQCVHL